MTDAGLVLMQTGGLLSVAVCPCGAADMVIGEFVVALTGDDGRYVALCTPCARRASPEFAVSAEVLGALAATLDCLPPEDAQILGRVLVEKVTMLAQRSAVPANANPTNTRRRRKK